MSPAVQAGIRGLQKPEGPEVSSGLESRWGNQAAVEAGCLAVLARCLPLLRSNLHVWEGRWHQTRGLEMQGVKGGYL